MRRVVCLALVVAVGVGGCRREERRFRESPPATTPSAVRISSLQPGAYVVEVVKDGIRSQQKFIKK